MTIEEEVLLSSKPMGLGTNQACYTALFVSHSHVKLPQVCSAEFFFSVRKIKHPATQPSISRIITLQQVISWWGLILVLFSCIETTSKVLAKLLAPNFSPSKITYLQGKLEGSITRKHM